MMRSLFSGVSGLKSHQTRMDSIGNNIANVNTTGYKSSRVTFADTLYQTSQGAATPSGNLGGTNPKQIGLGVGVAAIDTIFTDSSASSTGKNTDLALSGDGLFTVKNGKQTYYTRDGNFALDADYNYVNSAGYKVQGYMASSTGVISAAGEPEDITIPLTAQSMPAAATSAVQFSGNLNSAVPTITKMTLADGTIVSAAGTKYAVTSGTPAGAAAGATKTDSITVTLSDGTTTTITADNPAVAYEVGNSLPQTQIVNVYDSLGNLHKVPMTFTKTPSSTTPPLTYDVWEVALGATSIKETDGSTTTLAMTPITLQFDQNGKFTSGTGSTTLTLTNGAGSTPAGGGAAVATSTATITMDALTQYAGSATVKSDSDGNAAGSLSSISIDSAGVMTGTYTNGLLKNLAQVAVAQFPNASGLTRMGNNLFQLSNNSGTVKYGTAADLGCKITPSALEMSNVDVANEFSDMIITQRGFQSNSKVITVGDEMLETVINMKR